MRIDRDLAVTAEDGTVLLVDHHHPYQGPVGAGAVVWIRTPYGRKQIGSVAKRFARRGAHVVVEAIRGTAGSAGSFDGTTFEPGDGRAVAAWLRAQPWFPGVIVTWGLSALGYASWALAGADVAEWRGAILQDAHSELRDAVVYPGGAFAAKTMLGYLHSLQWPAAHPNASLPRTMLAEVWASRRARKVLASLPLGSADQRLIGHRVDYYQDWLAAEQDDTYWKLRDLRVNAATMPGRVHLASGWYDICLASVLADYAALRAAGKAVRLIIGPWYHGRGSVDPGYRADLDTWLDAIGAEDPPRGEPVRVHVGGGAGWRELPDWPPPGFAPRPWHLQPDGGLSTSPAGPSEPDRYRYDPAEPTPAVGGAMENFDGNAGAKDNRKLEARPDVLTYTSPALTADLEVIGRVSASIVIRSSRPHTDLCARLCDVAPDGRSTNLCDGAYRLRPAGSVPNADGTHTVELDLLGIAHRFGAGHRIRVQISSGAHPRLARNTGTGEPLTNATRLVAADQEIFHDPDHVSVLQLPAPDGLSPLGL
jgi:uncharacterized protein